MEASGPVNQLAHEVVSDGVRRLFDAPGPLTTVYLHTESDATNAAQRNELRWRSLRSDLEAQGAPAAALDAITGLLGGPHHEGDTLAAVASADGTLLHVEHLPEPPTHDWGVFGPIAAAIPLVAWRQSQPAYAVVLADRTGADILGFVAGGDEVVTDEVGDRDDGWRMKLPSGGGWSQARFQRSVKDDWMHRAQEVAGAVDELVDRIGARLVVVSGDDRAIQLLRQYVKASTAERITLVDGGRAPDGGSDHVAEAVVRLVASSVASQTVATLEHFRQELGQADRAVEGAAATLAALSAGQVETLLIGGDPDDDRTAWFDPAGPIPVAPDETTLRHLGVTEPTRARLQDVALRAAVGTSAGVWVVPVHGGPAEGIGAVLRWA